MTQTGIEPWTSRSAVCLYPPDHTQYLMEKSYTVHKTTKVETFSVQLIGLGCSIVSRSTLTQASYIATYHAPAGVNT